MHRRRFLTVAGVAAAAGLVGWGRQPIAESDLAHDTAPVVDDPRRGAVRIVWSVETDKPVVALTFDDGPDPAFTPRILDILGEHGVTATFMAMGHNAAHHPDLLRRVVAAGHEVGHHSLTHLNLALQDGESCRAEILEGARTVQEVAGVPLRYFRPPKGRMTEAAMRVLATLGHDVVLWSITRGPLAERDPSAVARHVVDSLEPGGIIDLHDGIGRGTFNRTGSVAARLIERRETEVRALPAILQGAGERGIRLVPISQLLAAERRNG